MTDGVVDLAAESFDAAIAEGTVLVDFWAAWCGPCHAVAPVLAEIAAEDPTVRIAKLDVQDHPTIGDRFDVTSLPTLIVFRDGVPVKRLYGATNKRQLTRALDEPRADA